MNDRLRAAKDKLDDRNGERHYIICPKCRRQLRECECHGDAHEPEPPRKRAYSPELFNSAEFFAADFRREFFVNKVLVRNQPCVLGGVKKSLKSGVAIDLAISLDTATPFLSHEQFTVARPARVMLVNGESGNATVQETARRIASARGIGPAETGIGSDLAGWPSVEHLRDLAPSSEVQGQS